MDPIVSFFGYRSTLIVLRLVIIRFPIWRFLEDTSSSTIITFAAFLEPVYRDANSYHLSTSATHS